MAAEYRSLTVEPYSDAIEELNALAQEGWTVKAAYTPTHFLLERLPPALAPRSEPKPPTGPGGRAA